MALINRGDGSTMSGSLGNTTHTTTNQVRKKSKPTNKRTQRQLNQQSLVSQISQSWRTLSEADRQAWNSTGSNFQTTDPFGNRKSLKGNPLYMQLNQMLSQIAYPLITVPPNPTGGGDAPVITAVADVSSDQFDVVFSPSPQGAGYAIMLWATVGVSAGKKFVANQYKYVHYIDVGDTTPADIFADYVAAFGSLVAGSTIYLKAQSINVDTGETGSIQTTVVVVTA